MRRDEIVAKARSAIGHGTLYRLGAGAPRSAPHPWDETGACDCSGFVCWVLGLSRYQPLSFLIPLNGGWLNTDGMVCDSLHPVGYFEPAPAPQPGDLIVYPSAWFAKKAGLGRGGPRIGHVGILTEATITSTRVVHCSSGNYRTYEDSIRETSIDVFRAVPYYRYLRFSGAENA